MPCLELLKPFATLPCSALPASGSLSSIYIGMEWIMKLKRLSAAVSLAVLASLGVVGCHDSKDRGTTFTDVTVIDGYLQNATCCVDTTGDKSCEDESSITQTTLDGVCTVDSSLTGPLLVFSDDDTTDSDTKGVAGTAAPAGLFLTAPQGSVTATPLTTLIQIKTELFDISFEEAAADLAEQLGLDAGTDFTNFDYVALSATSEVAAQVKVVAEIVSTAIAANVTALQEAEVSSDDPANQLLTAVNLLVNPDNDAGVKGSGTQSLFDAIVSTVQAAEDPEDVNYQNAVEENPAVTSVDDVDTEDLENAATETENQTETPVEPPPTGTGATGGTGGAGG